MGTLTLTVLRSPEGVTAEQRTLSGGELVIGRGADCGWRFADRLILSDLIDNPIGPVHDLAVSPDGKWIAYTGYDSTSDTWIDSKLYIMASDGSGSRVLLDIDRSPAGRVQTHGPM